MEFGADPQLYRNDFDTYYIKISIDEFEIVEIKAYKPYQVDPFNMKGNQIGLNGVEGVTQENMSAL